jgi:GT2 family glycosyltransferase
VFGKHPAQVDNASSDDSLLYLQAWAEGRQDIGVPEDHPLKNLSQPPLKKPLSYAMLSANEAAETAHPRPEQIIFIHSERNRGFAGGNNLGIQYALRQKDAAYIWILNNDTVIAPDALAKLIECMQRQEQGGKKIGILGSKLLYYDVPELIQAVGGRYNKWLGVGHHIGANERDEGQFDRPLSRIDYIVGAAMLVPRAFLDDAGLLAEDYFMYFEEPDWAARARQKGWELAYCWESRVYHKEGRSIGSHASLKQRQPLSDYYLLKNRLVFTRKFYKQCLPGIWASYIVSLLRGILLGKKERIRTVWRILKEELG